MNDDNYPDYSGYNLRAAPPDAWRTYDEDNPDPGYFEFDWLSARHPDLYHKFGLTTAGLMNELDRLVDLTGLVVADIGAGTGRSTVPAALRAREVIAVDAYESVLAYGRESVRKVGLTNVTFLRGNSSELPIKDSVVDAVVCAWAELNHREAYRILKPRGYLIQLVCAPGSICGELTATLAASYPSLITEVGTSEWFDPDYPAKDSVFAGRDWNGIPMLVNNHDFTFVADYGDVDEAAAILGRMYGPVASRYMRQRMQATLAWRLRITLGRVAK